MTPADRRHGRLPFGRRCDGLPADCRAAPSGGSAPPAASGRGIGYPLDVSPWGPTDGPFPETKELTG